MKLLFVFLVSLFGDIMASRCERILHGKCYSIFYALPDACRGDNLHIFRYCGRFRVCCYSPHQSVTSAPVMSAPVTSGSNSSLGTCGTSLVGSTNRIVGGSVAQHGEFPWQASLRFYNHHVCGGTLISDRWILTAGHCVVGTESRPNQWKVGLGIQSQSVIHQSNIFHVSAVYKHPRYNDTTLQNDIALMKLGKSVDMTGKYVRSACLPRTNDTFDSDMCTVSGWGATYFDEDGNAPLTDQLEYVNIQTITNQMCSSYLGKGSIYSTQICAGATSTGGKDACQGDSGGPLVCKRHGVWEITGVVSWGYGCGEPKTPGVYTRVSSYLHWIAGILHDS